jgi:hypothetical protein
MADGPALLALEAQLKAAGERCVAALTEWGAALKNLAATMAEVEPKLPDPRARANMRAAIAKFKALDELGAKGVPEQLIAAANAKVNAPES